LVKTFRLILEYDGTDFEGWQSQPAPSRTVQSCLGEALEQITGSRPKIVGSGRTDSGVHARGQVACCRLQTRLGVAELHRALNATLPADLAVRQLDEVSADFDPRRAARSKLYRYCIWNGPRRSPLRARCTTWVREPLDLTVMRSAACALQGTHDFASFQAAGSPVASTIRTLCRVELRGRSGADIELDFEGTGFLRYMVRNLTGTLLEIGRGRRAPEDIDRILAARDRAVAGRTAPAEGLTLLWVRYDEPEAREPVDRTDPTALPLGSELG
jgi:tRNA pseudouridine38-40 synthase